MTDWDYNILLDVLSPEVINATDGTVPAFSGLSIDSRTLKPHDIFFAIIGDNNDGHKYLSEAFERGAAAAVVNKSHLDKIDTRSCGPLFVVDDTHEALLDIAAYIRRHLDARFAGVTGSNGKTTTKEMLYAIISEKHTAFRSPGNLNNLFGLPISLGMMSTDVELAVFELGISTPGEMSRLSSVIKPDIAIITNIGPTHLETLGTLENVVTAKFELIDNLPVGAVIILNADDAYLMAEAKKRKLNFLGFGIDQPTDFQAADISSTPDGDLAFTVNGQRIELNALGRINIYNALAAIAASSVWKCAPDEWASGLKKFSPIELRMVKEHFNGLDLLVDCYNANPGSTAAALDTLNEMNCSGRKIAVLGDMLELGDTSAALHREVGQKVAQSGVDFLFCLGQQSAHIAQGAKDNGLSEETVFHFAEKQDLLDALLKTVHRGDLILFKASRGMELEKIIHGIKASAFMNN